MEKPVKPAKSKKTAAKNPVPSAPAAATDRLLEGPVHVDGNLHFSKTDLLIYENAQLELQTLLQQVALKRNEADRIKREAEEKIRQLNVEVTTLSSLSKGKQERLEQLHEEVRQVYKVDPQKMAYDDKTGKITIIDLAKT